MPAWADMMRGSELVYLGHPHPQMLHKRIKIPIAVEQGEAILDAARGDQGVDGFADGDALGAKGAVVLCGLEGDVAAGDVDLSEGGEEVRRLAEFAVAGEALQDFGEHQIADRERLAA